MSNKEKWRERVDWCLFFGDIVDACDAAGCPPADNIGAAHLFWAMEADRPLFDVNPSNALASVVLGGFGNRAASFRMDEQFDLAKTPEQIKELAEKLTAFIRERRG